MLVLGLDTTTRRGSVALVCDGELLGLIEGDAARAHAERLPGEMLDLLAAHGRRPDEVDVFSVATGPGSFTGLRIGIAAMQGLAFGTGRPLIGISALEALADAAWRGGLTGDAPQIGVWMDAQRGEVFTAVFAPGSRPDSGPTCLDEPAVELPVSGARRWRARLASVSIPVVGDGAIRYCDVLATEMGPGATVVAPPPLAPSIARLAAARAAAGDSGLPHAIRPLYVRRSDAELARDKATR
jgi:tRNA threonylcarbamoyladenosine biosynthesis protein TsaB